MIFAVLVLLSVSCNKDENKGNAAPELSISKPVEGQEMQPGDNFEMVIDLSDDMNLRQCIVEIHHNFDTHTHKQSEEPWYYHRSFELMGIKSTTIKDTIQIPETIGAEPLKKGNYHFYVTVEDLEGIVSVKSENIVIK